MYISLLFWLLLLIPGYALVRHVAEKEFESGLLGVVALSYLATFALLSPFSILCYVFKLPLWVFTGVCILSLVVGLVEITRHRWWRGLLKLLAQGLCVELVIVLADMVMGGIGGALIAGDAVVHLARIRTLLDYGFNNFDPFVGPPHGFPIYHTNLLHAIYAVCCQVTGLFHTTVWFTSLPWAKLLVASGGYYLAWCVFERRWVAWVAAVFTVGCYGPVTFILYPNKLAPLWVCAILIGWSIRAGVNPGSKRWYLYLGAGSIVLGQLHGMYAGFACVMLMPTLGCLAAYRWKKRNEHRWSATLCAVAILAGAPFPLLSRYTFSHTTGNQASITSQQDKQQALPVPPPKNKWTTMGRKAGWGTLDWRCPWLVVGTILALRGPRKKQAAMLLAITATVALIFYVPPLCSSFIALLGKRWMVARMSFVLSLGFLGLGIASIAYRLEPVLKYKWLRASIGLVGLAGGIFFFSHRKVPYTWPIYWKTVASSTELRQKKLSTSLALDQLFKTYIPSGATVLADPWQGMLLAMVHNCYIIAPKRGGMGITDIRIRREDHKTMLAANTAWSVRHDLLQKYRVSFFVPGNLNYQWATGHAKKMIQYGPNLYIIELDLKK